MTLVRLLHAEAVKLRQATVLLALFVPPLLPGALLSLSLLSPRVHLAWMQIFTVALQIWTTILFPLAATVFTAAYAQIEHKEKSWDHILALPHHKALLFSAKLCITLAAIVVMQFVFIAAPIVFCALTGLVGPKGPPSGLIKWDTLVSSSAHYLFASLLMIAVQLWAALRISSFAGPILIGIGGTVISFIGSVLRRPEADYFPWRIPALVLNPREDVASLYFVGGWVGILTFILMIADLSRREVRG